VVHTDILERFIDTSLQLSSWNSDVLNLFECTIDDHFSSNENIGLPVILNWVSEAVLTYIVHVIKPLEQVSISILCYLMKAPSVEVLSQKSSIRHIVSSVNIILWWHKTVQSITEAISILHLENTVWTLHTHNMRCDFNELLECVLIVVQLLQEFAWHVQDTSIPQANLDHLLIRVRYLNLSLQCRRTPTLNTVENQLCRIIIN